MENQRVERRLSAVLAADVAGYSRLVGIDEEGTLAQLRSLRAELIDPAIATHRGRLIKTTGDGILVEFPSVVDAGRFALEVQRAMKLRNSATAADRRIEFRIGIHLGDVVVDGADLLGDAVNIAARLEGIADPGGITLSEDAWRQVRDKLPAAFVDLGEQRLKNIARPVRAFRIDAAGAAEAPHEALALPDKPSIAVLPFQNISGDPEQEYFTDGMVEDVITGLSRISWLFVIARNSSFAYKGKSVDMKQVGRELGVRYVLEGSVRKSGQRLRITAQLIEADTGAHLWADRYDGVLEDVFDLQDKITETIVGIIEPSVRRAEIERARRKRPDSLGAYDLYLRALPHTHSAMPEDALVAIGYLEEAIRLDPDYAAAHAALAVMYEVRYRTGSDEADRTAGVRHARLALALGTDDAAALAYAAITIFHLAHDFETAAAVVARSLSLNASCATALYWAAHIHALGGDPALAEDYANRALRLSPFDPTSFEGHLALGAVQLRLGRYDDAAGCFARAVHANPRFSVLYVLRASALALAGRIEEAKAVARRLLELDPSFRVRAWMEFAGFLLPDILRGVATGLRQAGLPE